MTMRARPWLRPALGFLTLTQAVVGIWQLLVPRSFYDLYWVELLPPYNEHLLRDVGGLNLALAVVLGASVLIMDRRLISTALPAYLTFATYHQTATPLSLFQARLASETHPRRAVWVTNAAVLPPPLLRDSLAPYRHRVPACHRAGR
jgi:hypothetical protein